jgi:hypothetical protein
MHDSYSLGGEIMHFSDYGTAPAGGDSFLRLPPIRYWMQHLGVDTDVQSDPYYWGAGNMEVRALDLNSRFVLLPVDLVLFVSTADNYLDRIHMAAC